jgi:hypothetical protein
MKSRYAEPQADGSEDDRREYAERTRVAAKDDRDERARREGESFGDSVRTFFGVGHFPSYETIVKDSTVKAACDAAWAETKATTVDGSRREQGFWIRWNAESKAFSITGHGVGASVDNDTGAAVSLPNKPADTEPEYTVASFHTHTPTVFREVGRPTGPSGADLRCDKADNVAGLVYDYSIKNAPKKHPLDSPAKLYSTGQKRSGAPAKKKKEDSKATASV